MESTRDLCFKHTCSEGFTVHLMTGPSVLSIFSLGVKNRLFNLEPVETCRQKLVGIHSKHRNVENFAAK